MLAIALILAGGLTAAPAPAPQPALSARPGRELALFTVREGYEVSIAVETLPGARFIEFDDRGTLYVSRPTRGDIIALRDEDGDGLFERRAVFVRARPSVHGLHFAQGSLWFTTSGSISRARDTTGDLIADEIVEVIPAGALPRGGHHWYRSILVTDDALYTSIGDSSNISDQFDTERQKIWAFALDGSGKRLFASGVRNSEKLRLRPGTSEIWGVDHGSDWFGALLGEFPGLQPVTDVNPPDEFNRYVQGGFYGHPYLVGNRLPRPEYAQRDDLLEHAVPTIVPEWSIPAHFAANAFCFVEPARVPGTGAMPDDHHGDAFIACRGSWNSTTPVGYCVTRVLFDQGKPYGQLTIVSTLEASRSRSTEPIVHARPVDCAQAPDGSILFSSDQPGRIYRIRYVGGSPPAPPDHIVE